MSSPFAALRVRNFRLYFVGQIISNVGTWFQSIAQALLVIELTGSGKALGIVTALQFLPMLLLGVHGGVMADRVKPRTLLLTTAGLAALLATILALVTALHVVTIWWVWGLALCLGCVQAFDRPTSQAFLYEMVGPEDLSQAVGLYSITQSSARMVGPALGGAAYALFGSAPCFAINGASFLFVIVALVMMRTGELWPRQGEQRDAGEQVREGLRYAWHDPQLRGPLLANLLIGCLAFNFMILIAAMTKMVFHANAAALGSAHALNAVGAVIGGLLFAMLRKPSRLHLAMTCFAMAVTILVNALAPSLTFFLLWAPIFGLSVGAYQTTLQSSVQRATPPAMMGRISGLLTLGSVGTTPIGAMIVGWLIDTWSARAGMGLGALACLVGGIGLLGSFERPLAEPRRSA
ncbi:MAG: MFS transporter [Polyangiales bacterium]